MREELVAEIENGVRFWEVEADSGYLIGVMGTQDICDPIPILHARLSYGVSTAPDRRPAPPPPPLPRRPRAVDPGRPFCRRRRGGRIPRGSGRWAAALGLRGLRRRRGILRLINKSY